MTPAPAPWRADNLKIKDANGHVIAEVTAARRAHLDVDLMTAAPDMVAAIEAFLLLWDDLDRVPVGFDEEVADLRKAVRRARGV